MNDKELRSESPQDRFLRRGRLYGRLMTDAIFDEDWETVDVLFGQACELVRQEREELTPDQSLDMADIGLELMAKIHNAIFSGRGL